MSSRISDLRAIRTSGDPAKYAAAVRAELARVDRLAALGLTRAMSSRLVGVTPIDPLTFSGVAVLFLFISALGSWMPAHRVAGLDPSTALREE